MMNKYLSARSSNCPHCAGRARPLHSAALAELLLCQHYAGHAIALRAQMRDAHWRAQAVQELFVWLQTLQQRVRRMRLVVSPEALGHDEVSRLVADPCLDVAEIGEELLDTARIAYGLDADATEGERRRSTGHLTDLLNEMSSALARVIATQTRNPARYHAFERRDQCLAASQPGTEKTEPHPSVHVNAGENA